MVKERKQNREIAELEIEILELNIKLLADIPQGYN